MLHYSWEEKAKSKAEYSHFQQSSANAYVSEKNMGVDEKQ